MTKHAANRRDSFCGISLESQALRVRDTLPHGLLTHCVHLSAYFLSFLIVTRIVLALS